MAGKLLDKSPLKNKRVLITCGPTWTPIDDVRVISNQSTGELGQKIATHLVNEKANVTLVEGAVLQPLESKNIKLIKFKFFDELYQILRRELKKKYDVVIHAAAVSDYKLKTNVKTKISSNAKTLKLELVPTKKLISMMKKINPNIFLVGFKLESKMSETLARQESLKLFVHNKCDLVLANSSNDKEYKGFIVDNTGNILAKAKTRNTIAKQLVNTLKKKL